MTVKDLLDSEPARKAQPGAKEARALPKPCPDGTAT